MSIPNLSTGFKDDVLNSSVNQKRRYHLIYNNDGTVSLEDVTAYSQTGSDFGAAEVNKTNQAINNIYSERITKASDLSKDVSGGRFVDAAAIKELKTQLDEQNSASIPGNLTEVEDPNKDTGLTVQYRIGFYSTEVFIFGNLKGSFTAWQPKDLGWIPRPNRPALAIIQYSIEPYYIQIQPDGMVQIVSRIDTTADGTYIGEHCMFLNATI